jgi:hypothetical protein
MSRRTIESLRTACAGLVLASALGAADAPPAKAAPLPVRGIHLAAPGKRDLPALIAFVRGPLAEEGVNTLILEFNYGFDFTSRPEFANPSAPGKDDVAELVKACREKKIELIPQLNCLGHQSWAKRTDLFLTKHPEFDETPGKYPNNEGIYCRSYCPLHPEVHKVLFALIGELARACEAKSFHVGMDEVFILADADCPRCKGKDRAELLAGEVSALAGHLASLGCRLWMWGDRFIDGAATGIGEWEASKNGTASAIDKVPKNIVICDWHYEKAWDTPRFFAEKGFQVVACPWRKADVARGSLAHIAAIRSGADRAVAARALGVVQTTWCGCAPFAKAYADLKAGAPAGKDAAPAEAAKCFRELFAALRAAEAERK